MAQVIDESRRSTPRGAPQPEGLGRPRPGPHPHGRALRGMQYWPESRFYQGRFGRMFRELDALPIDPATAHAIAAAHGRRRRTSREKATTPASRPATPTSASSSTTTSRSIRRRACRSATIPTRCTTSARRRFDLDSVYGRGPDDQPYMYDGAGRGPVPHRPRPGRGRARPAAQRPGRPRRRPESRPGPAGADRRPPQRRERPRVAAAPHDAAVPQQGDGPPRRRGNGRPRPRGAAASCAATTAERFAAVQQVVRWHYQWVVVHDFLRRIVGRRHVRRGVPRDERRGPTVRRPDLDALRPPVLGRSCRSSSRWPPTGSATA